MEALHRDYLFGRGMLEDKDTCSLKHRWTGERCRARCQPTIVCHVCKGAHYCSYACLTSDVVNGWHTYLDEKILALGPTLPVYHTHFLARELRTYASNKALDMLLADPTDINRPMIPALHFQCNAETEALSFIGNACPFPKKTQGETLHMLLTHQKVLPEQASYLASRGEAGLAYAAVITLIKMNRYRDLKFLRSRAPGTVDEAAFLTSTMTLTSDHVTSAMCEEAQSDFHTWLTAVAARKPDFWVGLMNQTFKLVMARSGAAAGRPEVLEAAARDAAAPTAPEINALSWALPAWWAASAPYSKQAADWMVGTLVRDFKYDRELFNV
ncbi:hypothetical protein VSDG_08971 [Cytospora chrysosperma]|uniref:Uncharacterized protein n=1 Tax=Cytospora chrysosperma TaxID=252740 RepID=A0A423VDE7_CYTCH|nr:hypothetical protein VSDG_08971 [Valsa sordida]